MWQLSPVHVPTGQFLSVIQVQDAQSWRPCSVPTQHLPGSSPHLLLIPAQGFGFFFLFFLSNPLDNLRMRPEKNSRPFHTQKSGVPKAALKLGLRGWCCAELDRPHPLSASGEISASEQGFQCKSFVYTWTHTHNENAFHKSSLQQLLKTHNLLTQKS